MRPSTLHSEHGLHQGPTFLPLKYPCPVYYPHCPLANLYQPDPCRLSMLQASEPQKPTSALQTLWSPSLTRDPGPMRQALHCPGSRSMHISLSVCRAGMGHPTLQSSARTIVLASLKNTASGAGKMAQQVKVLAAKPYFLSSIPAAHMVEGENRLLRPHCPMTALFRAHTHHTYRRARYF